MAAIRGAERPREAKLMGCLAGCAGAPGGGGQLTQWRRRGPDRGAGPGLIKKQSIRALAWGQTPLCCAPLPPERRPRPLALSRIPRHRISPLSTQPFASLNLNAALVANLESLDYRAMTPIKAQSLPAILAGRDLIGQVETGSGTAAAFGLGLLAQPAVGILRVQALVLRTTRNLS